jgi:clan AA aspartic protease
MRQGYVRDGFPRVTLPLPGFEGPAMVEFVIDTGFEGEMALPPALLSAVEASSPYEGRIRLADGSLRSRPYCNIVLNWDEGERLTRVLVLEGNPLIGNELMFGSSLEIEMIDGGSVVLAPL